MRFLKNFPLGFASYLISFLLLLALLAVFYCSPILFHTADLGRHIKNGEVFFNQHEIIKTNFYSYTEPDNYVINHHWGAGCLFYLLWKAIGFKGLSYFYMALMLLTFAVYFALAWIKSGSYRWSYFLSILVLPLIVSRLEIRPEGLSYLFAGIFLLILFLVRDKRISEKFLFILPFIELLWVNSHIFFIFGLGLIGAFWFESLFIEKSSKLCRWFGGILLLSVVTSLCNPFGIKGVLEPFLIFKEYGYMLAENQSVLFMQKRFPDNVLYLQFEIVFGLMMALWIIGLILKGFIRYDAKALKEWFIPLVVMLGASLLAWKINRMMHFWGLFFIPLTAIIIKSIPLQEKRIIKRIVFIIALGGVIWGITGRTNPYSPYEKSRLEWVLPEINKEKFWFGYTLGHFNRVAGLLPGANSSGVFFTENKIEGPIFNNYDIGGYLIFHLFPQHRLFVDNRPEAYSVDFFKKLYVPMQESEYEWLKAETKYQFNAIYFFRHDMTPWAQPFLIKRVQDRSWAPIYVDAYTLILVKRNQKNAELIRKFELPLAMFNMSKN